MEKEKEKELPVIVVEKPKPQYVAAARKSKEILAKKKQEKK